MKKHVFEIKDFAASEASAKHILENIVKPILNSQQDIEVS